MNGPRPTAHGKGAKRQRGAEEKEGTAGAVTLNFQLSTFVLPFRLFDSCPPAGFASLAFQITSDYSHTAAQALP